MKGNNMITSEQKVIAEKFLGMAVDVGNLPRETVDELLNGPKKEENIFLLKKEVAQILKCSIRQVDKLTEKGLLKKHYIGKASPRFVKSEVLNLIFKKKSIK